MTLDELHKLELSLMRKAFENACAIVDLPLDRRASTDDVAYAEIAKIVQILVEQGHTDPVLIAKIAAESYGKSGSEFSA